MTDMLAGTHCPRGAAGRVKRRGAGVIRGRDDAIAAGCGATNKQVIYVKRRREWINPPVALNFLFEQIEKTAIVPF